jgi:hypothetical protein
MAPMGTAQGSVISGLKELQEVVVFGGESDGGLVFGQACDDPPMFSAQPRGFERVAELVPFQRGV